MPPTLVEEQTVLQKVTEVSRHYGEALSARFGQLYRNITGSPHKPFNPQTFSNALTHFSMLAVLVFGFYWLIRLCALPLYRKMGQWARQKNRERSNWLQLPAMIIGAFIIDLLLLCLLYTSFFIAVFQVETAHFVHLALSVALCVTASYRRSRRYGSTCGESQN